MFLEIAGSAGGDDVVRARSGDYSYGIAISKTLNYSLFRSIVFDF